ncbi:GNAT family N-acetyltransferase [Oryzihumus sp.]
MDAAPALPEDWTSSTPDASDVTDLLDLLRRHERTARGWPSASRAAVETDVCGRGAAPRRHLLLRDGSGAARGWATVHDRAAARVVIAVVVDPDLDAARADDVAAYLFEWAREQAADLGRERGVEVTQMDSGAFADDPRQQLWLTGRGFLRMRSWWQMSRPVTPEEGNEDAFPPPGEGVTVRLVAREGDAMPEEEDLRTVHDILETSFTDHFNSHQESFDEFVARLREDPGHRWDHWWIAELERDGMTPLPVGALVGSVSPGTGGEPDGSYVEYLGVLAAARGRGVARSLLHAVIADAARRGRDRVGLEVDADSPTGATALYEAVGFATTYVTQSWHRDLPVD